MNYIKEHEVVHDKETNSWSIRGVTIDCSLLPEEDSKVLEHSVWVKVKQYELIDAYIEQRIQNTKSDMWETIELYRTQAENSCNKCADIKKEVIDTCTENETSLEKVYENYYNSLYKR